MTIHRDSFNIYCTEGAIDFPLTGASIEDVCWRNLENGILLVDVDLDTNNIVPSACIYRVTIDKDSYNSYDDDHPLCVLVESFDSRDMLGPVVESDLIAINVDGDPQTHIIPGLSLTLATWAQIDSNFRFHIIVGGMWSSGEQRYLKKTIFGNLSSSGPVSETTEFTIENTSLLTLSRVEAKVVNRLSLKQGDDTPFTAIHRNNGQSPPSISGTAEISFDNLAAGVVDVFVDDEYYDLYEVATGVLVPRGEGVSADGTTEYVFADSSPYAGLSFVLSASLVESSIGTISISNGSSIFEIQKDDDGWITKGEKILLSDSLAPDATVSMSVRANPDMDEVNPTEYPVEGLIEVVGYTEATQSLFSGSMAYSSAPTAGYTSVRAVVGPFNFSGTKVRVKFADTTDPISDVYIGERSTNNYFASGRKVNLTFDGGKTTSSSTTNIWTDWIDFEWTAQKECIVSYEGGLDRYYNVSYYGEYSYRCLDGTSDLDVVAYHTALESVCLGIAAIEIAIEEPHIGHIPLAAVVRDQIPSQVIGVNILDNLTSAALNEFGIYYTEIS